MLKLLITFTLFSNFVFAQTGTTTPGATGTTGAGSNDAWAALARQMGMQDRAAGLDPLSREAVDIPGLQVMGAIGRRCVHMVKVNNKYYRKNYWFNVTDIQKRGLSKKNEYFNFQIGHGEQTNGWHQVPLKAYENWNKLTNQLSPQMIANCRCTGQPQEISQTCQANGVHFPPSISGQTETPGCNLIKGASVLETEQYFNTIMHPKYPNGPSIVWNTRLKLPAGFGQARLGITGSQSKTAASIVGVEIFNGNVSAGAPQTQSVSANQTVFFPLNLTGNQSFVIKAMSPPMPNDGYILFFANTPPPPNPQRITDNIGQCGLETPSAADLANMPNLGNAF